MKNLVECSDGDELHIEVTYYETAIVGTPWVKIRLSDGTTATEIRMSGAQARDLLGTLANELAQYADAETVVPPIEATYTPTDEGKAAVRCEYCLNIATAHNETVDHDFPHEAS
jgi:hypothetical protein